MDCPRPRRRPSSKLGRSDRSRGRAEAACAGACLGPTHGAATILHRLTPAAGIHPPSTLPVPAKPFTFPRSNFVCPFVVPTPCRLNAPRTFRYRTHETIPTRKHRTPANKSPASLDRGRFTPTPLRGAGKIGMIGDGIGRWQGESLNRGGRAVELTIERGAGRIFQLPRRRRRSPASRFSWRDKRRSKSKGR